MRIIRSNRKAVFGALSLLFAGFLRVFLRLSAPSPGAADLRVLAGWQTPRRVQNAGSSLQLHDEAPVSGAITTR
jgi:hypothetical protein